MKVALTFYGRGFEKVEWVDMPAVPQPGDRLHAPNTLPDGAPLRSWLVHSVTWQSDHPTVAGWFPEVSLTL